MKNRLNLAAIGLLLLVTGCGTFTSHWRGGQGTYQGVRFDCDQVANYSTESEIIAVADIPLSLIMDTLFLPYDLSVDDKSEKQTTKAEQPALAESQK